MRASGALDNARDPFVGFQRPAAALPTHEGVEHFGEALPYQCFPVPTRPNTCFADGITNVSDGPAVDGTLSSKKRRRGQIWFWGFVVLLILGPVLPTYLWPSGNILPLVGTVATAAGALVSLRNVNKSNDAADRAEAAKKTAERASWMARYALALHLRPNVGVDWYQPVEGFTHWNLHLTADRPAKDIKAEWHFADGKPPIQASFPDIAPDPNDRFHRSRPRQVIPLGIPASVKPADMHKHIIQGTLEYTDAAGLARWKRTWRYLPLGPEDNPEWAYLNEPKTTHEWELVELLDLPGSSIQPGE